MKKVGAAVLLFNEEKQILLVHHTYGPLNWELPGGGGEEGESPMETALREVREETGLTATLTAMNGVYYDTSTDGVHFLFTCIPIDPAGIPQADGDEISECRFFPVDQLPRPMSDYTLQRIDDGLKRPPQPLPAVIGPRVWLY